jgi:hypothetical protein
MAACGFCSIHFEIPFVLAAGFPFWINASDGAQFVAQFQM